MFTQNVDGAWSAVLETGKLTMPYSKRAKVSYVDYRDVAETAAVAMTGDAQQQGIQEDVLELAPALRSEQLADIVESEGSSVV